MISRAIFISFLALLVCGCARAECRTNLGAVTAQFLELLSRKSHTTGEVHAMRERMKALCQKCANEVDSVSIPMTGTFDKLDFSILANDEKLALQILQTWNMDQVCRSKGIDDLQDTRMNRVARWGSTAMISMFAKQGCELKGMPPTNTSALHASIGGVQERGENSQLLIQLGVDVNQMDSDGSTALDDTILSNDLATLKLLLNNGAKVRPNGNADVHTINLASELGSVEAQELIRNADELKQ